MFPPSRIVYPHRRDRRDTLPDCEQDRIVGISGYVVRPPQAFSDGHRLLATSTRNWRSANCQSWVVEGSVWHPPTEALYDES